MATLLTRYAWNVELENPSTQGGLIPVRGKKFRRRLGLGGVPGRLGLNLRHESEHPGSHWQTLRPGPGRGLVETVGSESRGGTEIRPGGRMILKIILRAEWLGYSSPSMPDRAAGARTVYHRSLPRHRPKYDSEGTDRVDSSRKCCAWLVARSVKCRFPSLKND
jgi:hypothetical protein